MLIGQEILIKHVENLVNENKFPRCSILIGQYGSGKKSLALYIAGYMRANCIKLDNVKVDTIREMIHEARKQADLTVYIIPNADTMSNSAKNSLLKILEEPPYNAYFILTVRDENLILDTIKSRSEKFYMQPYKAGELKQYALQKQYVQESSLLDVAIDICETPYEIDLFFKQGGLEFLKYVDSVIENIEKVSGANSFKIVDKIALKNEEDKYDLRLFWKIFMRICLNMFNEVVNNNSEEVVGYNRLKYASGIKITSKYLQELNITGINKQMTFDAWLLDIRKSWMENEL